ncbi:MAG: GTPase ObgE [Oscillospiraceae bacterium]|nr:GTPase ObgE [Oscillospiraceae bacterium]MDY4586120.1 GTPase ObgE [Oscillospiraceae bacterium]
MAIQFVDVAKIHVKAGNGGNGVVTFHREKYVAAGGPDGGDGGRGGNVVFRGEKNLSTLMDFRYKRKYAAQNGEDGRGGNQSGRGAEDLIVKVPIGTVVKDAESGLVIADVSEEKDYIIAKGGKGGLGNQHFATPTRQIPNFAKPGYKGEERDVILELKLIADVGLIGFPNVGKSTLISTISSAKPKIANYHFTTLSPVLGVVRVDDEASFVAADIPGIIEGASEGVGLGHDFLRHVERCRLLLHVVDVSGSEGRDPIEDFKLINKELVNFSLELSQRPQIAIANKADIATQEQIDTFKAFCHEQGIQLFVISAATRQGLDNLVQTVYNELQKLPPVTIYEPEFVEKVEVADGNKFEIHRADDAAFEIDAPWLLDILYTSDIDDYSSLQYFQRRLQASGIIDKLKEMGVKEGDTIRIDDFEFDYVD